jgi:UDP-3-O-[3-hydroxymyristoyl] glucosamine N-acyltransferase
VIGHKVTEGSLLFVDNKKYYTRAIYSSAVAIIVNEEVECPEGKALLVVEKPFEAYNQLALHYSPFIALVLLLVHPLELAKTRSWSLE